MGHHQRRNVSMFLLSCLAVLLVQVNANFARVCPLGLVPPKWLVIDDANDTKKLVSIPSRRLRKQEPHDGVSPAWIIGHENGDNNSPYRMLQVGEDVSNNTRIIQVIQCICGGLEYQDAYCEAINNACGVYFDGTPGCYVETTRLILLRNAWPIVILWYAALMLFIFLTQQGRHARQFLYVRCCNRRWNHQLVDQILEPNRRRRLRPPIQFWDLDDPAVMMVLNDSPEGDEREENNAQPRQLALKTKRFAAPAIEEEEPPTCTICFGVLQDGDRVGALPCQHEFHVDCLKTWICRRNVCPLCQAPNVATPHAEEDTEPTQQPALQESNAEERIRRSLEVTQETVANGQRPVGAFQGVVVLRRNGRP